jgi:hypothetical protein
MTERLPVEQIGAEQERFLDRSRVRVYVIEQQVTEGA